MKKPAKKAAFEVMLAAGMDSTLVHPFMQAAAAGRDRVAAGLAQALITYVVALTSRQLLDEAALVEFAVKVSSARDTLLACITFAAWQQTCRPPAILP